MCIFKWSSVILVYTTYLNLKLSTLLWSNASLDTSIQMVEILFLSISEKYLYSFSTVGVVLEIDSFLLRYSIPLVPI